MFCKRALSRRHRPIFQARPLVGNSWSAQWARKLWCQNRPHITSAEHDSHSWGLLLQNPLITHRKKLGRLSLSHLPARFECLSQLRLQTLQRGGLSNRHLSLRGLLAERSKVTVLASWFLMRDLFLVCKGHLAVVSHGGGRGRASSLLVSCKSTNSNLGSFHPHHLTHHLTLSNSPHL